MDYSYLADLLFPDVTEGTQDILTRCPKRDLPEGAKVTRFAPSPTGFMHIGNLFGALIDERLAHQSGGIFYLRIEDTDLKRSVEGGTAAIIRVLSGFGLDFDEGAAPDGQAEKGVYGPYRQRQRAHIYHVFAKQLVSEGRAYPCFCTPEELEGMRSKQESEKANFGYYGKWAKYRDADISEIERLLSQKQPYVLRLRSAGDPEKRINVSDLARGTLSMPQNNQDIVLLKSDGIPTYHFAHAVDDTLMRTTHVVRGEEWLATLPIHIELFSALGFKPPKYLHTPVIMKLEGESKRKLSKRKDPEAALDYYYSQGYMPDAVLEYLMTVLNSNFEEWRKANPLSDFRDFVFSPKKVSVSGALFDLNKLIDVSKNVISRLSPEKVLHHIMNWAKEFDPEYYALLQNNKDYALKIFSIDRGGAKPRKDISKWSDAKAYSSYFYDELFNIEDEFPENIPSQTVSSVLSKYAEIYDPLADKDTWFGQIKALCEAFNFAANMKDYKKNPQNYQGSIGDLSTIIRIAVTGRKNTPDLFDIMQLLGHEKVLERIRKFK